MNRFVVLLVVLVAIVLGAMPVAAEVITPPAINMPYGGKIVTEINLSDNDVLGIVKQSIPAVGDVLKDMAPAIAGQVGMEPTSNWAEMINLDEFSQAVAGVKDVRLLIARYPQTMTPQRFLSEFTAGVAKTGRFNKTVSDFGFFPGSVALFSAPENGGIIGFAFNPNEHVAYAVRVVGGLDMPELIRWSGQIAKYFMHNRTKVVPDTVDQPYDDQPPATEEKSLENEHSTDTSPEP